MNENEIGKRLLNLDTGIVRAAAEDRQLARKVLQRDQWRVWLLAILAILLWLVAAAGVFFVVYVAIFHLYPKQQQLMRDAAIGNLPVERMIEIQSLHFRAVEICTLVVASAFVAATLAVACTVLLVLVSRQVTMRHINTNLMEIFERLQQQRF
jgi:hypothetical protein